MRDAIKAPCPRLFDEPRPVRRRYGIANAHRARVAFLNVEIHGELADVSPEVDDVDEGSHVKSLPRVAGMVNTARSDFRATVRAWSRKSIR